MKIGRGLPGTIRLLLVGLFAVSFSSEVASADANDVITLDPLCANPLASVPPLPPGNPAPSTRQMVEHLAYLYGKTSPDSAAYLSEQVVRSLEKQLASTTNAAEQLRLKFYLGLHQINLARPDSALNTFHELERTVEAFKSRLDDRTRNELRLRKAMAYFRLGEQENCLVTDNSEACLFPLKPSAHHLLPRGSKGAIEHFTEYLEERPNDLSVRWLLNLAHMTLGEYPEKVNPRYLIAPKFFASEFQFPTFPDVGQELGIANMDLAGGSIVDDFDNDGFYDLVISAWDNKGQLRYYRNNGNGTFVERTSEAGLVGEVGALNISQTDYNNDGLLDIWMMRGGWIAKAGRLPSSLLRNNGNGTFTDVTVEAGLLRHHPTMSTCWFDYDGDGWLDLFIGNESVDPSDPDPCELFHNNGDGTFTEVARASGINIAQFVKGVACADYDNDGRPDLYLSVRGGKNILLHNDGPRVTANGVSGWRFSDVSATASVVCQAFGSFGTFFFDYNNDGWEDLVVFGYDLPNGVGDVAADYLGLPTRGAKTKLFRNRGNGVFEDASSETRLDRVCHTMGHNFGDLDNDGWLDFYCGTGDPDFRTLIPNRMFRNAEGRFFQDVTTATGTGHIQKGHGISFADLDDDGDQDIYVAMGGAYSGDFARNALFLNPGASNSWLKLKLIGTKANRAAIGARVVITLETPAGQRQLHRVVSSGGCFGANPLRLEVGLDKATAIKSVEIRWPGSNRPQVITGLIPNRGYAVTEGEASAAELKIHPVQLGRGARPKEKLPVSRPPVS